MRNISGSVQSSALLIQLILNQIQESNNVHEYINKWEWMAARKYFNLIKRLDILRHQIYGGKKS